MPAYFKCPKCKENNYGQTGQPEGLEYLHGLQCKRCGFKNIYWVADKNAKELLVEQMKVSDAQIAVGVEHSEIGWIASDIAAKKDEGILDRLNPFAKLEQAYSQGERTKNFLPSTTPVKEGQCEGQCLHWIRRVLQGGNETYKASSAKVLSDEQILFKQQRQHKVGAVTHLKHRQDQQAAFAPYKKAEAEYNDAAEAYNRKLAQYKEIEEKFAAIMKKRGFEKENDQWVVPDERVREFNEAIGKWNTFVKQWQEDLSKIDLTKPEWSYATFWNKFAADFDSYLDQKVKVSKRRFSNIVVVKTRDRKAEESPGEFVRSLVNDTDFCPGTCALLSVGLAKGIGEGGGSISGHAIAAHFKSAQEFFLFDPNLGIFKSTSKLEFQRTIETTIATVWTKDLKWNLDGEFGYSLFRTRDKEERNLAERGVPFSDSLQFTAAENKALGTIPAKLKH